MTFVQMIIASLSYLSPFENCICYCRSGGASECQPRGLAVTRAACFTLGLWNFLKISAWRLVVATSSLQALIAVQRDQRYSHICRHTYSKCMYQRSHALFCDMQNHRAQVVCKKHILCKIILKKYDFRKKTPKQDRQDRQTRQTRQIFGPSYWIPSISLHLPLSRAVQFRESYIFALSSIYLGLRYLGYLKMIKLIFQHLHAAIYVRL